jgi:diguanylate cyclase (GGDEF)-like protein
MCSLKYDGEALIALGDAAHAVEQLTSALELAHECSGGHDVAQTQRLLAVALADLGRLEEAEALLVEASHPQGTDAPRSRAEAYEALSRVRELRGDGTGALAAMREAWLALLEAERIESAGRAAASVIRFETVQARAAAERAAADATILAEANAALELAKTRAERALRIDPLTATTTRRHGVELLRRGLRARPDGLHRLGMLLVDIDRFKEVNDTWGHAAGDAVLAEVARQIKLSLRLGDVTVRWGGEEFLVLLPELDSLDVVQTVAERIRARVEARPVPLLTSAAAIAHAAALSTAVTVSVGALFVTPPADSRSALAAVDAALYRAKAAGRNRVCAEVFDGS